MERVHKRQMLVWDCEGEPPQDKGVVVLWRRHEKEKQADLISLPSRIDADPDRYRGRYLEWVYELGNFLVRGDRIIDHLRLRRGFSYWWMTKIAQKFNSSEKSQINEAIKFMAMEEVLQEEKPKCIELHTSNKKLALVFKNMARNLKFKFAAKIYPQNTAGNKGLKRIYERLPWGGQASLFFFWYLCTRWLPLLSISPKRVGLPADVCFFDIFVHLKSDAIRRGSFESNYWTDLVDFLRKNNIQSNWVHRYFKHADIDSIKKAQNLVDRMNSNGEKFEHHVLADKGLRWTVWVRAIKDYIILARKSISLSNVDKAFTPNGGDIDFWPLFKDDWYDSLIGPEAVYCCLRLCIYEEVLRHVRPLSMGVYIQENQPWEMALIHAWRSAGHGMLIGAPHTTVRYWDLRYFYDKQTYRDKRNNSLPMPDRVAVNGPVAKRVYLQGGYPKKEIVEVEALRYLGIQGVGRAQRIPIDKHERTVVLMCGDFLQSTNQKMIAWLTKASDSLPSGNEYIVKPHPAFRIESVELCRPNFRISEEPLEVLMLKCDVVFTSNITSAAVNAYCLGLPVVQMLDGRYFNMSPLRDTGGSFYVKSAGELAQVLKRIGEKSEENIGGKGESYFYLDRDLPRWDKLLGTVKEGTDVSGMI